MIESIVTTSSEVLIVRDDRTAVRDILDGELVVEWPFAHLLTTGGVTAGLAAGDGGFAVLVGWLAHQPPVVLNGVPHEAQAGEPFREPLFTDTRTAPPASVATLLHGPEWLRLERDFDGEWELSGTPPLEALGETFFLSILFHNEDGLAHEWSHQLTVTEGGAPEVAIEARPARPLRGDDVQLDAIIRGQRPFNVTWFKDGVPVPGADGETLHLAEVSQGDSATFVVRVTNAAGTAESAAFRLNVQSGPLRWAEGVQDPGRTNALPVALPADPPGGGRGCCRDRCPLGERP